MPPKLDGKYSLLQWLTIFVLAWCFSIGVLIVDAGKVAPPLKADVAIVLGAATYKNRPSPVFEQRIRHAIALYTSGQVDHIIFTGGYGADKISAESLVARNYAIARGIPDAAIFVETRSHTTLQNLQEAQQIMSDKKMSNAVIVTDPLHTKRALKMAYGLNLHAKGSPTPTTRYIGWKSKLPFLLREIYFYNVYVIFRY